MSRFVFVTRSHHQRLAMNETASADPEVVQLTAEDYTTYKVGRALYVYFSPFLLVFGLIGNVLSFLVMSKRAKAPPPTYLYLTVLAVVDVLALYVPCVRGWLVFVADVDLMYVMHCSWYFIVYFSVCNISVYIVVCVTVDRFIHTFFPLSAKRYVIRIIIAKQHAHTHTRTNARTHARTHARTQARTHARTHALTQTE